MMHEYFLKIKVQARNMYGENLIEVWSGLSQYRLSMAIDEITLIYNRVGAMKK